MIFSFVVISADIFKPQLILSYWIEARSNLRGALPFSGHALALSPALRRGKMRTTADIAGADGRAWATRSPRRRCSAEAARKVF